MFESVWPEDLWYGH